MAKIIITRLVEYKEDVVLDVDNATSKADFMEAILQNKPYKVFPLTVDEQDIIYTYEFGKISDEDIMND